MSVIPVLQHVPEEGPAGLWPWAASAGLALSPLAMWQASPLPDPASLTGLIILGGPMNTDEEARYSWMTAEKRLIEAAIARGIPVLGICLGAQLIADVLGARVSRNRVPEIGWFDVRKTPHAQADARCDHWPDHWTAFHWHGDTFEIPDGAVWLAESDACAHQAYGYGDRVLGLQCHPEVTPDWVRALTQSDRATLCRLHAEHPASVQLPEALLGESRHYPALSALLPRLLNPLFQVESGP